MSWHARRRLRAPARLLLVALLAAGALLGFAVPASAHAELESTDPVAGATLTAPPGAVTLRFSEPVEVAFGAIRVYDAGAHRVDAGGAGHVGGDGTTIRVPLRALGTGFYVATWRVVSADGHPVQGAFTFRVGTAFSPAERALAERLLAQQGGSTLAGAAYAAARLLGFAAVALLAGGLAFVAWCWPGGLADDRARRLLVAAAVAVPVTAVLGIALQGVTAGALPLPDVVRPSVFRAVLETRFGRAWAVRLLLGPAALVLLARWRRPSRAATVGAGALGLALVATVSLAGHATTGLVVPLALASDLAHVAAMAVWLGGLALLATCALPAGGDGLPAVVGRFSRVALTAVAVLLATGLFQSWRTVGTPAALTGTDYGRLLLGKLAAFAVLVGLGAVSRSWVRRKADAADVRAIRRSVAGEVVVAVVVLALTALLVNTVPARTAYARAYSATLTTKRVLVDVVVDPAKAGPVDIHAYTLSPAGQVAEVAELTATLTLAERDVGPLDVPLVRAGPGHFVANGMTIPLPGRWRLDVAVRTGEAEVDTASTTIPVR